MLQVKTLKIKNTINIKKLLKYLILFFYVSISQNDYNNNNLYRKKKLKNPNNTLISPIGSDSITIFSSKNRTVSIRLASLDE